MNRPILAAALVAACLVPVACGKKKQPAPTQPAETTGPSVPGVPALTADQKAKIDVVFDEAAEMVAGARSHLEKAREIQRSGTIQDAYAEYRAAKKGFREAMQHVEPWLQEEFELLSREQIDAFMRPYQNDVERWQKDMGSIPKVPPAE